MKYVISEVLNEAIMTKTPTVIVEGVDDVKIYDKICKELNGHFFVIPIECIDGYSEGNNQVILAMNDLLTIPSSKHDIIKYIIGIIDKDVRDYRKEIPQNSLIFPLNSYSIESHFVNKDVVKSLISEYTRITEEILTEELLNKIYEDILSELYDLYILSLEALKGSIDNSYQPDFSYSFKEGRVTNITDISKVMKKEKDLLEFAKEHTLNYDIESIKKITKGKWLLFLFCYLLEKHISNLPDKCTKNEVPSCRICKASIQKCLYKIKDGVTHKILRVSSLNVTNTNEFDYLRKRLNTMVI